MVLMRKDVLYECVKRYVKKRKEDPYAFFTPSLRTRKFNFSCCADRYGDWELNAICSSRYPMAPKNKVESLKDFLQKQTIKYFV